MHHNLAVTPLLLEGVSHSKVVLNTDRDQDRLEIRHQLDHSHMVHMVVSIVNSHLVEKLATCYNCHSQLKLADQAKNVVTNPGCNSGNHMTVGVHCSHPTDLFQ